jgi:pimeloyl-ACP methyl ester carboxylesterase
MEITVNGYQLHYEQYGQGEDVLLLHGWGSSLDAFAFLGGQIAKNYRVTALDFPGFGKSQMPDTPWCVEDYAGLTLAFMKELGLHNPIMAGHSFGGRVIIKLCGTGRVTPKKIILIDAAGVRRKPALKTRLRSKCFKIAKWGLTRKPWAKACEPTLAKVRACFGSADYNNAPPVLRQTLVQVVNEDLTHHLKHITASTLLIYGENDTATPVEDAKIMEREIPDAGLCVIPDAGHWAMVEKAGHVAAIIKSFLNIG